MMAVLLARLRRPEQTASPLLEGVRAANGGVGCESRTAIPAIATGCC